MEFSIAQEAYVFLASALCGVFISVIYDVLRVIRLYAKTSYAVTNIEDIIFWFIALIIMFFTVFYTNYGYVRWYEFLGVFLGALLYFLTISKTVCMVLKKFIEIFFKIFVFFCKILLTPLVFTYNIIYKSILFIFVPVFKFFQKIIRRFVLKIKSGCKKTKTVLIKK
ncbi:MAG: spore cortex biosynthesis protein YabQ [Clostridia bacterium]|nr:spore cortex biosynthesis protein YabQ [Clostridia bacterium]